MSLFLPFVWLCHQPSVAAWPLSSRAPSSPFPPLLTRPGNFPMEESPKGRRGGIDLRQQCGRRRKEGKKKLTKKNNRLAWGAVTKRGHEWRRRRGF